MMHAALHRPLWRYLLAVWLLLANLSLGLYHQHGEEAGRPARTVSSTWHYHPALFGMHLDLLSVNADDSPFDPETTPGQEAHVLLGSVYAADQQRSADSTFALMPVDFTALPSTLIIPPGSPTAVACLAHPAGHSRLAVDALGARSGVQQI